MCLGITVNKDKVGNLIRLLADHIQPLYHTKLLKLLYLIDEKAVKETGSPVTWLTYQVWQYGPVSRDVYDDKFNNNIFSDYISIEENEFGKTVSTKGNFNDGKFSEYEMDIIGEIIYKHKHDRVKRLIDLTHEKGGLWKKAVETHNISFDETGTSPFEIDLSDLVRGEEQELIYCEERDMLKAEERVNNCYCCC